MKWWVLSVALLMGCGASTGAEEARAAKELAPRPANADQVAKIKARFPQAPNPSGHR